MPDLFQRRDPDTGDLVDVTYYDADDVAHAVHVSPLTVKRKARAGTWPHLRIAGRYWWTAEDIDRIHELSRVDPDAIPEGCATARLGVPLRDEDLEPLR